MQHFNAQENQLFDHSLMFLGGKAVEIFALN